MTLIVISILSFSFHDYKKINEIILNIEMKKTKKIIKENIQTTNNEKYQIKNINKNNFSSSNIILEKNEVKIKLKKKN